MALVDPSAPPSALGLRAVPPLIPDGTFDLHPEVAWAGPALSSGRLEQLHRRAVGEYDCDFLRDLSVHCEHYHGRPIGQLLREREDSGRHRDWWGMWQIIAERDTIETPFFDSSDDFVYLWYTCYDNSAPKVAARLHELLKAPVVDCDIGCDDRKLRASQWLATLCVPSAVLHTRRTTCLLAAIPKAPPAPAESCAVRFEALNHVLSRFRVPKDASDPESDLQLSPLAVGVTEQTTPPTAWCSDGPMNIADKKQFWQLQRQPPDFRDVVGDNRGATSMRLMVREPPDSKFATITLAGVKYAHATVVVVDRFLYCFRDQVAQAEPAARAPTEREPPPCILVYLFGAVATSGKDGPAEDGKALDTVEVLSRAPPLRAPPLPRATESDSRFVFAADEDNATALRQLQHALANILPPRVTAVEWLAYVKRVDVDDNAVYLTDVAFDKSFPSRCPLDFLPYRDVPPDVVRSAPLLLSSDGYERGQWNRFFHIMLEEARIRDDARTKSAKKASGCALSWEVVYPGSQTALCVLCGTTTIHRAHYVDEAKVGAGVDQAHIAPAQWGLMNDKHWWNIVPTCECQRKGAAHKPGKAATDSHPTSHMFVDLANMGRLADVRRIAFGFFALLQQRSERTHVASLPITPWSLISFIFGFYTLLKDPHDLLLSDDKWHAGALRWDLRTLWLTPTEVATLLALRRAPPK